MPKRKTVERARQAKRKGKSPSTQAGEFVREEIEHIREGKHGARSAEQVIAIGLSKARRAGVKLKPPRGGQTSERTRKSAEREYRASQRKRGRSRRRRSRAALKKLKSEPRSAASHTALSRHARAAARQRKRK